MEEFIPLMKSVLATVLLLIAVVQLGAISLGRGWIGNLSPSARARLLRFHRLEGYVGLAIIAFVALNCLFVIEPLSGRTFRVGVHAFFGAAVTGLVFSKFLIARVWARHYPRLPLLGAVLFAAIIPLWLFSAAWYFFLSRGDGY